MTKKLLVQVKGGPGSGNWGHTGRPGLRGGSGGGASTGGAGSVVTIKANANKASTEQIDAIVEGSRKVGEEYFGTALEWHDPREFFGDNVDVVSLSAWKK